MLIMRMMRTTERVREHTRTQILRIISLPHGSPMERGRFRMTSGSVRMHAPAEQPTERPLLPKAA